MSGTCGGAERDCRCYPGAQSSAWVGLIRQARRTRSTGHPPLPSRKGAVCGTVGCVCKGIRKAGRDPLPNPAVYEIKAAPAAPLARRQRPGSAVERLARRTPGHTRAGTQTSTAHTWRGNRALIRATSAICARWSSSVICAWCLAWV